jgi:hypothetical protein
MKTTLILFSLLTALAGAQAMADEQLVPAEQLAVEAVDSDAVAPGGGLDPEPPIECVAINARGDEFSASGYNPLSTQRRAMDRCYARSVQCYRQGCHHVVYPR